MRTPVFLFAVLLTTIFLVAESPFTSPPFGNEQSATQSAQPAASPRSADPQHSRSGDGVRMWRRAEVHIVPTDMAVANRVELESLRTRAARCEADVASLNSDPATREQLQKQLQLIRSLLTYAERNESDAGKSPTALEVQRHLNEIEGRVSCESCHAGVVAER
jgi:hypothetical protein